MRYSIAASLLLLSLTAALQVVAQEQPAGLKRGHKVRVYAPSISGERIVGEVGQLTDEIVEILPSGQSHARHRVPLAEVERLEISRGSWSIPLGLVIGSMAGAVASLPLAKQCGEDVPSMGYSAGECAIMVPVGFGLAGGALGAGIGWLIGADNWEAIPFDQLRVQPVATPDGVGVVASVKF